MYFFPKFKFQSWRPSIIGAAVTGGISTSGQVQTVKTDGGGRWKLEASGANLNDPAYLKAWRQFEAIFDGGAQEVIINLCDRRNAPFPIVNGRPVYGEQDIPFDDGAMFDDGAGWAQSGISAKITLDAALRGTTLNIRVDQGAPLIGGEHFSLLHPNALKRLYRIRSIVAADGAGNYQITIRPPLREAVSAGTEIDFDNPGTVCRLLDVEGYAPTVDKHRYARGTLTAVESFDYAN